MKKNKAQCQRVHAKKRALERYDLDLNRDALEEIVSRIQNGVGIKMVLKQSLRISHYEMTVQEKLVRVVYDRSRKTVVTFLPLIPATDIQHDPVDW